MVQVHGLHPADAQKEHQQRLTEETIIIVIIMIIIILIIITTIITIMMITIIIIIMTTTYVFAFLHFGRKLGSWCCLATRRLNHLLQKAKNVDKVAQAEML